MRPQPLCVAFKDRTFSSPAVARSTGDGCCPNQCDDDLFMISGRLAAHFRKALLTRLIDCSRPTGCCRDGDSDFQGIVELESSSDA